ncbi:hypothetical protein ERX35_010290 [Macrococcus equipercicus]|uniref:Bacterial Ig domain-containing protein n=1 Tax=Macrococcus equipercicus TaxID=69967 RepID=A0ABQ6R6J9_9STAP|nr:Ig-like domain-containing protein [Macrococcus equipercicus]KAA1036910.1 hypothetical protein ERX35_010290 [Macrococcus equipercicus]
MTLYSDYKGVRSASVTTTVIGNSTPTISTITNTSTKITGKAKSDSTVKALVNNKVIGTAKAKYGTYSIAISKLPASAKVVLYSDYKGVKSTAVTTTVLDKVAPSPATVNKMTTRSISVSGKGEKYAIVEIYKGKSKYATGKVSSKNTYSIKVAKQKRGTVLTVYLKDKAGNKSKGTAVKVS